MANLAPRTIRGEESRGMMLYQFGDIDALTAHLKQALLAPATEEVKQWGAVFQGEAETNLARWQRILKLA